MSTNQNNNVLNNSNYSDLGRYPNLIHGSFTNMRINRLREDVEQRQNTPKQRRKRVMWTKQVM